jgi:hypothetical protein
VTFAILSPQRDSTTQFLQSAFDCQRNFMEEDQV